MNPSAQDILRGCVENLEELVAPELASPHAKSAMMCARMLINHVILRLDGEGEALATDCAEKRALFEQLLGEGALPSGVATAAKAMLAQDEPAYTSIAALTERNDAWKRLVEQTTANLAPGETRKRIRQQLLAQVGRENVWCGPALDGPLF